MDKSIAKRLEQLEKLAAAAELERAKTAPFCEMRVHSITLDDASVVYHHRRSGEEPARIDGLTVAGAFETALRYQTAVYCSLGSCCEWLFAFGQRSDLYTQEQKQLLWKQQAAQWPGVAVLIESADCEKFVDILAELPQNFKLK